MTKIEIFLGENNMQNVCDFKYLHEIVNGKKQLMLNIIDVFIKQVPVDLLCLDEGIKKSDYSTIKNYAHKMKSSVSIMGVSSLKPVLQEMEELALQALDVNRITELNNKVNQICKQAMVEIEFEKLNLV